MTTRNLRKAHLKYVPSGKELIAINIALHRKDGKVETDTVYAEQYMTKEDVEKMSIQFECDIIVSHIGRLQIDNESLIKKRTYVVKRKKGGKKIERSNETE